MYHYVGGLGVLDTSSTAQGQMLFHAKKSIIWCFGMLELQPNFITDLKTNKNSLANQIYLKDHAGW